MTSLATTLNNRATPSQKRLILALYRSLLTTCKLYDESPQLKAHLINPKYIHNFSHWNDNNAESWSAKSKFRRSMLKQAFGSSTNGASVANGPSLFCLPNAHYDSSTANSFSQILKTELRRSLSAESLKKGKKPMSPEVEIDRRINDMMAAFKLLNDNWSRAVKEGVAQHNWKENGNTPILRVKERSLPGVGGLLVAHPMIRGRMERKVILIVQRAKESLIGVVLNGCASDNSMRGHNLQTQEQELQKTSSPTVEMIQRENNGAMPIMSSDEGMIPTFVVGDDFDPSELEAGDYNTIAIPIPMDMVQPPVVEKTILDYDYDQLREGMAEYEAVNDEEMSISMRYHKWYQWDGPRLDSEPRFLYSLKRNDDSAAGGDPFGVNASIGFQIADNLFIAKGKHMFSIETAEEGNSPFEYGRNISAVYRWSKMSLRREIEAGFWFPIDQSELHHFKDLIFPKQQTERVYHKPKSLDERVEEVISLDEQKSEGEHEDDIEHEDEMWSEVMRRIGGEFAALASFPKHSDSTILDVNEAGSNNENKANTV